MPTENGREVHGNRLAFSGSVDGGPTLVDEDEVTMIVRGKVSKYAFTTDTFGVRRRVHSIKVAHAVEADEDTQAWVLAEIKRREDEETGQASLDDEFDEQDGGDDD